MEQGPRDDSDRNDNDAPEALIGSPEAELSLGQIRAITKDVKGISIADLPLCYYFCGALFVVPENREIEIGHWHFSTDLYLARIKPDAPYQIHNLRTPPLSWATPPAQWITFHFNVKPRTTSGFTTTIQSPHLTLRGMSLRRFTKYGGGYNPSRSELDSHVTTQQTKYRETHELEGDEDYFIWDRDKFLNSKVTIHIGEDPRELFEVPIDRGLDHEAAAFFYQLQSGLQLAISAVAATASIRMPLIPWRKLLGQISENSRTRSCADIDNVNLKTVTGFGEIQVIHDNNRIILQHIMGLRFATFELLPDGRVVLRDEITAIGDSIYLNQSILQEPTFVAKACEAGTWKRTGSKYSFSIFLHFVPAFALICQVCHAPDPVYPSCVAAFLELFSGNWWSDKVWGETLSQLSGQLELRIHEFVSKAPELLTKLREALFTIEPEAWQRLAHQLLQGNNHWKPLVQAAASENGAGLRECFAVIRKACLALLTDLDPFIHGSPTYLRERFVQLQAFIIWHILHISDNSSELFTALQYSTSSYTNQQLRPWLCIPFKEYIRLSKGPGTIMLVKIKFVGLGILICPRRFLSSFDLERFMKDVAEFVEQDALKQVRAALAPRVRK